MVLEHFNRSILSDKKENKKSRYICLQYILKFLLKNVFKSVRLWYSVGEGVDFFVFVLADASDTQTRQRHTSLGMGLE